MSKKNLKKKEMVDLEEMMTLAKDEVDMTDPREGLEGMLTEEIQIEIKAIRDVIIEVILEEKVVDTELEKIEIKEEDE